MSIKSSGECPIAHHFSEVPQGYPDDVQVAKSMLNREFALANLRTVNQHIHQSFEWMPSLVQRVRDLLSS